MNKKILMKSTLTVLTLVLISTIGFGTAYGYGGGGSGSRAKKATPATPAVPRVSPAIPATPSANANGRVLGAEDFRFLIDLRQGMTNNDVMELQKRLRKEGFFTYPTDTGYFGPITFASVKAYQTAHSTIGYVTGFVGPLTRAELNK